MAAEASGLGLLGLSTGRTEAFKGLKGLWAGSGPQGDSRDLSFQVEGLAFKGFGTTLLQGGQAESREIRVTMTRIIM